jgi:hypothetical protein
MANEEKEEKAVVFHFSVGWYEKMRAGNVREVRPCPLGVVCSSSQRDPNLKDLLNIRQAAIRYVASAFAICNASSLDDTIWHFRRLICSRRFQIIAPGGQAYSSNSIIISRSPDMPCLACRCR